MRKLTLADKTIAGLNCLSDRYVNRGTDADGKLRPSGCNGCDWMAVCNKIAAVIKEQSHEL